MSLSHCQSKIRLEAPVTDQGGKRGEKRKKDGRGKRKGRKRGREEEKTEEGERGESN